MGLEEDVHPLVAAALGDDVAVDGVRVTPAGRRRVVRITVERPVTKAVGDTPIEPLTLDEIADATRVVGEALDASDVMGDEPYTLEVSTPGTDRPLTEPIHFRRSVGRLVELRLAEGQRTGRVLATTAEGVDLRLKGTKTQPPRTEHIPFAEITTGVAQVEFTRPKSPGTDDET